MLSRTRFFRPMRVLLLGHFVLLTTLLCLFPPGSAAQGTPPVQWIYNAITDVASVAYSPNGKLLAVGGSQYSADGGVQIHTIATDAVVSFPTAANDTVNSVAFSPDGTLLAVGGRRRLYSANQTSVTYYGVLELWNVATGKRLAKLDTTADDISGHLPATGGVYSVAFSPNGKTLAVGGKSSTGGVVEFWSIAGRERTATFNTTTTGVTSIAFSPDGTKVADGDMASGLVEVWRVSNGARLASLSSAATIGIRSVAFSPDGTKLADGGQNFAGGVLEIWDAATGTLLQSLGTAAGAGVRCVAFSPNGNTLAAGGINGSVESSMSVLELWSVSSGSKITSLPASNVVSSVAFSPDGNTLANGSLRRTSNSGLVQLWNVATGASVAKLAPHAILTVQAVAFSPDSKILAASVSGYDAQGQGSSTIELRNAATGVHIATLPTAANSFAQGLAFSADGTILAVGGENSTETSSGSRYRGVLELWNVATGQLITTLPTDISIIVQTVAFSPDGKTLAAGGASPGAFVGTQAVFELWNVSTQQRITSQFGDQFGSTYRLLAFSPDSSTVVAGGFNSRGSVLEERNGSTGALVANLPTAATRGISAFTFSPDGKTLAVGGRKENNSVTFELFTMPSGVLRQNLTSIPGLKGITSLNYSPNGKYLFVGTGVNLQTLNAATGSLLPYAFQFAQPDGPQMVTVSHSGLLGYSGSGTLAVASLPYSNAFQDFNGDGFTDLLIQNTFTGVISAWYMQGSARIGSAPFSLNPSPVNALVGVGDFGGDGNAALVLQNRNNDSISLWYVGGTTNSAITDRISIRPTPAAGWQVVGVGDFNGDGKSDLVFQNRTTHQIVVWYMDGPNYQGGASLNDMPPPAWQVVGTGDFNSDGFADLVFQDQTTGRIALWYMSGVTHIGSAALPAAPEAGWKVVGVGDYNQDSSPDLLFQNTTSNRAVIWYLQDSVYLGGSGLSAAPPNGSQIVGPR